MGVALVASLLLLLGLLMLIVTISVFASQVRKGPLYEERGLADQYRGIMLESAMWSILAAAAAVGLLVLGSHLLFGRPWAWTAMLVVAMLLWGIAVPYTFGAIVFFVISADDDPLLAAVFGLPMVGLLTALLVYLYAPGVRAYFGKQAHRAFWQRREDRHG